MSWYISKLYRSPDEVLERVPGEALPKTVVDYIATAALELKKLNAAATEPPMVLVHGHGHLCHEGPGGGNYEVTTAKLIVTPLRFGAPLSLPLQVV